MNNSINKQYERETVDELVEKLSKYDIISFDIFDTLILRPFNNPKDLFKILSPYYNIVDFTAIRVRAQATARKKKKESYGHTEITINDIYKELNLQVGISINDGVQKEFELEKQFCYANPYMSEVYKKLLKLKKKIIIVSDMYFPSRYIAEILKNCGYINYDKLYVSCDYSATKHNGDLYQIVKKDYANKSIIHIGDNIRSDIENAKKNNIESYFYEKNSDIPFYIDEFKMTPTISSFYNAIVKNSFFNGVENKKLNNLYYKYGFIHSGLFVLGYVNWIHNFALKNNIDKILFLSRDGFILKKVYDMIYDDIESEYVLWSRHATLKTSPEKDLKRFIWQFILRPIDYSDDEFLVRDILKKSNLMILEKKLLRYNVKLDDVITKRIANILVRVIEENVDLIKESNSSIVEATKKYYSEKIKDFKNVCIVDIGYRGSGAIALKELFENWKFNCNVKTLIAYGLSRRSGLDDTFILNDDINAYVFNDTFNFDLSKNYLKRQLLNTALIDILLASAPKPSFLYFDVNENNEVCYYFEDEEEYSEITKIHQGIIDFVKYYLKYSNKNKILMNIPGFDAHKPIDYFFEEERFNTFVKDFSNFNYSVMISGVNGKTNNFYSTYNYILKKESEKIKKAQKKKKKKSFLSICKKKIKKNKKIIILRKLRKRINKILHNKSLKCRFYYTKCYENKKIDNNIILLQSYGADNFSGNPYYILKELQSNNKYGNYIYYIGIKKSGLKNAKKLIKNSNLKNVKFVILHSHKYCKILATAKYLINNVGFPSYFIKKDGQIFINTWHGTPLKGLGKSIKDAPHESGNYQRNFMMTDYFIHPNQYTYNIMMHDYMIENLYKGENLIVGYPRNSIFYDKKSRENLRKKLKIDKKRVIVYMPTWRRGSTKNKNNNQYECIENLLKTLNEKLSEDTIVYVKLHNLVKQAIDINNLDKIQMFPNEYETYEFLNIADCLITDYSSVFFDFANTRRKIVLYAYDKKEYMNGRSVYFPLEELPFPIVEKEDDLLKELQDLSKFKNYDNFIKKYCSNDSLEVTQKVCEYIFLNKKKLILPIKQKIKNDNILLFAGNLKNNYVTENLFDILNKIDSLNQNIYLCFYMKKVLQNKLFINEFSNKYNYITLQGYKNVYIREAICLFLYNKLHINNTFISNNINNVYKREIRRLFPNIDFSKAIDYSANSIGILNIFSNMNVKEKIIISFQKDFLLNKKKRYLRVLKDKFDRLTGVYLVKKVVDNGKNIIIKCISQKQDTLFSYDGKEIEFVLKKNKE